MKLEQTEKYKRFRSIETGTTLVKVIFEITTTPKYEQRVLKVPYMSWEYTLQHTSCDPSKVGASGFRNDSDENELPNRPLFVNALAELNMAELLRCRVGFLVLVNKK